MQNKENIHFLTEGYLDTLLLKEYLQIQDKQIHRKGGKGKIKKFLKKPDKPDYTYIAIVDDDNGRTINITFKNLNPQKIDEKDNFKVYQLSKKCFLIILCCPEIENWIVKGLSKKIQDYSYKEGLKEFRDEVKTKQVLERKSKKLEKVLADFINSNNFKLFRKTIDELYKSDVKNLKIYHNKRHK